MRNEECGMQNAECGMWNVECGNRRFDGVNGTLNNVILNLFQNLNFELFTFGQSEEKVRNGFRTMRRFEKRAKREILLKNIICVFNGSEEIISYSL